MITEKLIYKNEAMVWLNNKLYKGTVSLYENKCIFYNSERLLDQFKFDIKATSLICGEEELSFLDIYTKKKKYVQLQYGNKNSIKYFLNERRTELFIGKFAQRKAEYKNYNLVVKAIEFGYTGKNSYENENIGVKQNKGNNKISVRKPGDIKCWEDLLTPIEYRDYYNSLNAPGKKVYDEILRGIIEFKDNVEIDNVKLSDDAVGVIYHYILWDNPAVFCIGEYAMWRAVNDDGKHIKITSLCGGKESENNLRNELLKETLKILNEPGLYEYSDIQKEKYVHDYIVMNWPYDKTKGNNGERLEPYTTYGALVQKTAVCEGFAKTAKLLLDILGVHTQVVSGTILSENVGHAWNAVKINGEPYQLDITFDIGKTGGKQYAIRYDYFNVPDYDMIDRSWNDKNVVWFCQYRKYSYPACVGGIVDSVDALQKYIYKEIKKHKAYMYIKLNFDINGNKDIWLMRKIETIGKSFQANFHANLVSTDVKELFVVAAHYM